MKCACKDCTKRFVGCHATCADYAEFRKGVDNMRKAKEAVKTKTLRTYGGEKTFNKYMDSKR